VSWTVSGIKAIGERFRQGATSTLRSGFDGGMKFRGREWVTWSISFLRAQREQRNRRNTAGSLENVHVFPIRSDWTVPVVFGSGEVVRPFTFEQLPKQWKQRSYRVDHFLSEQLIALIWRMCHWCAPTSLATKAECGECGPGGLQRHLKWLTWVQPWESKPKWLRMAKPTVVAFAQ